MILTPFGFIVNLFFLYCCYIHFFFSNGFCLLNTLVLFDFLLIWFSFHLDIPDNFLLLKSWGGQSESIISGVLLLQEGTMTSCWGDMLLKATLYLSIPACVRVAPMLLPTHLCSSKMSSLPLQLLVWDALALWGEVSHTHSNLRRELFFWLNRRPLLLKWD